ncbi:MAG TPA: hypothetical protein VKY27_04655 [Bacteriovoracaceae bacterium]|nr:hypothetical protein [Bacteriovoracaceae bacterium]
MNKYAPLFLIAVVIILVVFRGSTEDKKVVIHTISNDHIVEVDEKEESTVAEKEKSPFDIATSTDLTHEEEENDRIWEENVRSHLLRQAFDDDFEVKITKENSFTWEELGNSILVDSIKVSLRNPAGETSTFRAIVDHNTGKVLRTWDRPIFDPVNPRERRGIPLNPLYHPND